MLKIYYSSNRFGFFRFRFAGGGLTFVVALGFALVPILPYTRSKSLVAPPKSPPSALVYSGGFLRVLPFDGLGGGAAFFLGAALRFIGTGADDGTAFAYDCNASTRAGFRIRR